MPLDHVCVVKKTASINEPAYFESRTVHLGAETRATSIVRDNRESWFQVWGNQPHVIEPKQARINWSRMFNLKEVR